MSLTWENIKHRIKNYFVAGLLTVIPLATTIWLMVEVATRSINFLTTIPKQVNPIQGLHPFLVNLIDIAVGFLAPVLFILLIGFMARNIVGQWLLNLSEQLLHAIPVAGSVYKTLKQLLHTLFSARGNQFRRVVLIEYPRKGAWSLGFVTGNLTARLGEDAVVGDWLSIFIPTTPNPTTGWYAVVRESETVALSMPVEDAFKVLISGGIVQPDSLQACLYEAAGQPTTSPVSLQELVENERKREARQLSLPPDPTSVAEVPFSEGQGDMTRLDAN